jgi:hypothetical protein
LNTVFPETTLAGIGIGSTIQEVRDAYDTANSHFFSPGDPPAEAFVYDSLGALFYASTAEADSSIIEIHIWDPTAGSGSPAVSRAAAGRSIRAPRWNR